MTESNKPETTLEFIEGLEQTLEHEEQLYFEGKKIANQMEALGIDRDNSFEFGSFAESLTPFEQDAIAFYFHQRAQKEKAETGSSVPSVISQQSAEKEWELSDAENPTLAQLRKDWLNYRSDFKASSSLEYERMTQLFCRVLAELNAGVPPRVAEITPQNIRDYQSIFCEIPLGANTTQLSLSQIKQLRGDKKANRTINAHFANLNSFLKWVEGRGYPINPAIIRIMSQKRKVRANEKKKRYPQTDEELKKLFECDKYRHGKFKRDADFWAPLIALFTGARQGEILQLYVADIRKIDGQHVIDFNNDENKQLKTGSNSKRIVPVHPKLKSLGLVDFAAFRKKQGERRLFPNEKRHDKKGTFHSYSRRFATLRTSLGVGPKDKSEFKDFHSFRHLLRTRLVDAEVSEDVINEILGHQPAGASIGRLNYTHSDFLKPKVRAMKKLEYDIDFSKIRNWKHQRFHKNLAKAKK